MIASWMEPREVFSPTESFIRLIEVMNGMPRSALFRLSLKECEIQFERGKMLGNLGRMIRWHDSTRERKQMQELCKREMSLAEAQTIHPMPDRLVRSVKCFISWRNFFFRPVRGNDRMHMFGLTNRRSDVSILGGRLWTKQANSPVFYFLHLEKRARDTNWFISRSS